MNTIKHLNQKNRVVITGIGPVTSIGTGRDVFFKNLWELHYNIKPIPETFNRYYPFKSKFYSPLPAILLKDFGLDLPIEKIMHEKDHLAVLATKLALEDAGFTIKKTANGITVPGLDDCGIVLGTGISAFGPACHSFMAHLKNSNPDAYQANDQSIRFNRMTVPMTMTSSPAAWIAIIFQIAGCSYTLNASCASGSYAIGDAFRKIREEQCKIVIAGGIEYLKDPYGYAMRGFDMLGTLTKAEDGLPRPFSKQRSGFLFSEGGACMLVLEDYAHALARKAAIYAEIVDFKANSDAFSIVQIDPQGKQIKTLARSMTNEINIDYLNTHGTATGTNDHLEAQMIQHCFGSKENQPVINSTKGILGHTVGASGAIEAAVTAMTIKNGRIHGNVTTEPIDNLNLNRETVEKEITYALSFSFGFGGHNSCLMMKKV